MKINELIGRFEVFTTNEERAILESMDDLTPLTSFTERERVVLSNLIRKSLVSKVLYNGQPMVRKNEL